jgi:lipopolysaccharide export system permease protein
MCAPCCLTARCAMRACTNSTPTMRWCRSAEAASVVCMTVPISGACRMCTRTRFLADRTEVERLARDPSGARTLSPEVLGCADGGAGAHAVGKLWTYIQHLRDNQQSADRFEIALWKKLIYPFAALVMMALALPFGFIHDRMGGGECAHLHGRDAGCRLSSAQRTVFQSRHDQRLATLAGGAHPQPHLPRCRGAILRYVERR